MTWQFVKYFHFAPKRNFMQTLTKYDTTRHDATIIKWFIPILTLSVPETDDLSDKKMSDKIGEFFWKWWKWCPMKILSDQIFAKLNFCRNVLCWCIYIHNVGKKRTLGKFFVGQKWRNFFEVTEILSDKVYPSFWQVVFSDGIIPSTDEIIEYLVLERGQNLLQNSMAKFAFS